MRPQRFFFLGLGIPLLFLLSACSLFGGSSNGANGDGQTPAQVMQNTFNAMQQLKTVHVNMNIAQTAMGAPAQGGTLNVQTQGDEQFPDQAALNLTIGQANGGQNTDLSEVVTGKQVYVQNPQGQWYVLDATTFMGSANNPFAGAQVSNYNNLLTIAQKGTIKDNGDEIVSGQKVRHLSTTFGKDALQDILNATGRLNGLSVQQRQNMQGMLDATKLNKATLDVLIDEKTSYIQRLDLKLNTTVNTATTAAPVNVTSNVDATIDYSKFNVPVVITAPTNATPTDDPAAIFKG